MPLLEAALDPACERAAFDAAALLETLAHEVEAVQPPWHRPGLLDLFTQAFGPAICSSIAGAAQLAGRPPRPEDMEAVSWHLWETSTQIDAIEGESARRMLQAYARAVTRAWAWLLGALALFDLWMALHATPEQWSWLANIGDYVVIGGFLLLEFAWRRRRFPAEARSFPAFVRGMLALGPAFWRGVASP